MTDTQFTAPMPAFSAMLLQHGLDLKRRRITTVQINLGKRCNQACHHCHVDAGPLRTEAMSRASLERLQLLLERSSSVATVDITGGAPELHPQFREFVTACRAMDKHVIDRCNLTVLLEPDQQDTARFLRDHQVHIIASLPCYTKEMLERQRGLGVFDKSIAALQMLNGLGYGLCDSALQLDLVYNPVGPNLPPEQVQLEQHYKAALQQHYGIDFHHLFTITNMPIKRFRHQLEREGQAEAYAQLLVERFNAQAAMHIMCTELISIAWDGTLYDCDFNQMEALPLTPKARTLADIDSFDVLCDTPIHFVNHCYGCTAGAGSSCQGALA